MAGQTFRENVSQDLTGVLEDYFGTAWGEEEWAVHQAIVNWAVRRFCPVCERGDEECSEHGEAPYPPRHYRFT